MASCEILGEGTVESPRRSLGSVLLRAALRLRGEAVAGGAGRRCRRPGAGAGLLPLRHLRQTRVHRRPLLLRCLLLRPGVRLVLEAPKFTAIARG